MLSLFGHAAGLPAAYGWGDDVSMAVLTGGTMVVLAVGMLALTWQRTATTAPPTDPRGPWLAMPAGVVTLGAAVLVWVAVADRDQSIVSGTVRAVAVLAVFTAGLVAFAVWMALRAEQARHLAVASQTRLFQFLDALPVAVSIRTGSGRPYYANDEAERRAIRGAGLPREQVIGTDYAGFFTAPDRAREAYRRVLADGVLTDCPLAVRRAGGEVRDVLVNASLYRDAAGAVLGVVATAHDITDRRRAEQERAPRGRPGKGQRGAGPVEHGAGPVQRRVGAVRTCSP